MHWRWSARLKRKSDIYAPHARVVSIILVDSGTGHAFAWAIATGKKEEPSSTWAECKHKIRRSLCVYTCMVLFVGFGKHRYRRTTLHEPVALLPRRLRRQSTYNIEALRGKLLKVHCRRELKGSELPTVSKKRQPNFFEPRAA